MTHSPEPYCQFPAPWGPFLPPLCHPDTPNHLNQSFTAFYRYLVWYNDQLFCGYCSNFRSLLEVQRLESDVTAENQSLNYNGAETAGTSLSCLRETMDTLSRGSDDLADLDMSKFEELVTSLNPGYISVSMECSLLLFISGTACCCCCCCCYCCFLDDKQSGDLFTNLKDSFSHFLRELSASGTNLKLPELEHFTNAQELYSSNEPSSQEFDWNTIL